MLLASESGDAAAVDEGGGVSSPCAPCPVSPQLEKALAQLLACFQGLAGGSGSAAGSASAAPCEDALLPYLQRLDYGQVAGGSAGGGAVGGAGVGLSAAAPMAPNTLPLPLPHLHPFYRTGIPAILASATSSAALASNPCGAATAARALALLAASTCLAAPSPLLLLSTPILGCAAEMGVSVLAELGRGAEGQGPHPQPHPHPHAATAAAFAFTALAFAVRAGAGVGVGKGSSSGVAAAALQEALDSLCALLVGVGFVPALAGAAAAVRAADSPPHHLFLLRAAQALLAALLARPHWQQPAHYALWRKAAAAAAPTSSALSPPLPMPPSSALDAALLAALASSGLAGALARFLSTLTPPLTSEAQAEAALLAVQCMNALARADLAVLQKELSAPSGSGGGLPSRGYSALATALGTCIDTHAVPRTPFKVLVAEQLLPSLLVLMGAWVLGKGGRGARGELVAGVAGGGASLLEILQALPFRFFTPGNCSSAALFPVFLACLWDGEAAGSSGGGSAGGTEAQLLKYLGGSMPMQPLADFIKQQGGQGAGEAAQRSALPPALHLSGRLPPHALDALLEALDLE